MKRGLLLIAFAVGWLLPWPGYAKGPGDEVIVVYNEKMPESKALADYYATKRQVPASQIFGFKLPTTETMTRSDYRDHLEHPLLKALEKHEIFKFVPKIKSATKTEPGQVIYQLVETKIRYAVLCYGVPVRILKDPDLEEKGVNKLPPEMQRNEAAVDSELALLPLTKTGYRLAGPIMNFMYRATNAAALDPRNGLLLVARLDGPSAAIARGLVDKALQAEADGLWGRAYFDARGLTNGSYKLGDDWIREAAKISRRAGFETVLDDRPETFPAAYPMSQIALYAGWYEGGACGPFSLPRVEFMPGAFAYHLHSFSAHPLRTATQAWAGPLLEKGATATMGCVDEPYLGATPDLAVFFSRFLYGFSFGEAAYASQNALSWQVTVVGDPLYRPFARSPQIQHAELQMHRNPLIEWSFLKVVNLNNMLGSPLAEQTQYLEEIPETRQSAVLSEKLASLYAAQDQISKSITALAAALKLHPSPMQRIRIMLDLQQRLMHAKREPEAYEILQQFVHQFPDYPGKQTVYQQLIVLAKQLGKTAEAEQFERERNL